MDLLEDVAGSFPGSVKTEGGYEFSHDGKKYRLAVKRSRISLYYGGDRLQIWGTDPEDYKFPSFTLDSVLTVLGEEPVEEEEVLETAK